MSDYRKTGEMSPAEKALEEEGKRAIEEVEGQKIEEFQKAAYVKPLKPSKPRYEESD